MINKPQAFGAGIITQRRSPGSATGAGGSIDNRHCSTGYRVSRRTAAAIVKPPGLIRNTAGYHVLCHSCSAPPKTATECMLIAQPQASVE